MAGKKDRKFVSIGKKIIWNITGITNIFGHTGYRGRKEFFHVIYSEDP